MSYLEILERFEEVVLHHENKKEDILSLSKLFNAYKKIIENFSMQLSKLHSSQKPNSFSLQSSLSKGFSALIEHLYTISESNLVLAKNLQIDIIEPLDLFLENYNSVHSDLKIQGNSIVNPLKLAQTRVLKLRSEYYTASAEAEKFSKQTSEDSKQDLDKSESKLLNKSETLLTKYVEGLTQVNKLREDFEDKVPKVMSNLQQNEESRVHFIKNTLEKYVRYYQKYENINNLGIMRMLESFADINPNADTQAFVKLLKEGQMRREVVMRYDERKGKENEGVDENDIPGLMQVLLEGKILKCSPNLFIELGSLVVCHEGRVVFVDCLEASVLSKLNPENLEFLAKYIRKMLDQLVQKNEYDACLFCKIIELSTKFFTVDKSKRTLSSYLCSHCIWRDEKRWTQGINYAVNTKMMLIKEMRKGRVKKGLDDVLEIKNEGFESSSACLLISQFGFQLAKLNVPLSVGLNVIRTACEEYGVSKEKQALLLIELYSRADNKNKKKAKSRKGLKDLEYVLYRVAKFFRLDEVVELICVNKAICYVLQSVKHKKVWSIAKKNDFQLISRRELWLRILRTHEIDIDYQVVLEKVNNSQAIVPEILHIIDMDVARSYQKYNEVNSNTLKNILKAFAYSYPAIGYCQGMNYVAGTLFLVIQDEALTFKALYSLIKNFKMTSLFNEKLKKLKKLFFILDRLISVFLPKINETFKDTWIFSDNYSSGWFIALFGNVFIMRTEILVQIWDLFLLQGWKGVFKVCLGILGRFQGRIVGESFENILSELGTVSGSDVFDSGFFEEVWKIRVSNSLINEIKTQFKTIA